MGNIKLLDTTLSNIIAAGEVIEAPNNIIKELVENSIDAKSKNIKIYLKEAGINGIKIVDDGVGMDLDDLKMCFLPHATSKINNEYDLVRVRTLGFRGEAIASISAISNMTIASRINADNIGNKITYRFGNKISEDKEVMNVGTVITIDKLFYNTPVRLKYLKSPEKEKASILYLIGKLALTHPNINFYLENDNQVLFDYHSNKIIDLIQILYGLDAAKNIVNISNEYNNIKLNIYYIKPSIYKSNKLHMTYIINNRYIRNNSLNEAVIKAFDTYLPIGKYPIIVIYIDIDPLLIDVNIHPKKAEIRIADENILTDFLYNTIKKSLENTNLIKEEKAKNISFQDDFKIFLKNTNLEFNDNNSSKFNDNINLFEFEDINKENKLNTLNIIKEDNITNETNITNSIDNEINIDNTKKLINSNIDIPNYQYIGIFNKTYIIFEAEANLYLVDQHAAAERINYEKFYKILSEPKKETIALLYPLTINLTYDESVFLANNLTKFSELGFILELINDNSYIIRSVPSWAIDKDFSDIILNLLDLIIKNKNLTIMPFRDEICKQISCKSSIKANDIINKDEALVLIKDLYKCKNPYNCPHGRPTIIKFSNNEIKKMFERIQK